MSLRNKRNNGATAHQRIGQCRVCLHPRRDALDKALSLGTMIPAQVAREVGCHRASVTRHVKRHLLPAVQAKAAADPELGEVDIREELRGLYRRMQGHLARAEETNNWQAIKGFHQEARQDLELLAKLIGQLDNRPQVNIFISPEWQLVRKVLLQTLQTHPAARLAVANALVTLEDPHAHRR